MPNQPADDRQQRERQKRQDRAHQVGVFPAVPQYDPVGRSRGLPRRLLRRSRIPRGLLRQLSWRSQGRVRFSEFVSDPPTLKNVAAALLMALLAQPEPVHGLSEDPEDGIIRTSARGAARAKGKDALS